MLGQLLECACSGVMACSTCHVYVDSTWMERVGAPSESEHGSVLSLAPWWCRSSLPLASWGGLSRLLAALRSRNESNCCIGTNEGLRCSREDRTEPPSLRLPTPRQDMLDLAHEPRPSSRLGCQLELRPELEGMVVHMPNGANNLFDHIPFE